MTMDISIVVPFRDTKNWIDQFMESVDSQTVQPKEIVFVDDASNDGGYEYLREKYAYRSSVKTISSKERLFPGGARNEGVRNATGKYVYFMDVDDRFVDEKALERIQTATETDPDVVCVSFIIDFGHKQDTVKAKPNFNEAPYGPVGPWAQVFKRELYVEMPEHTLSEDSPWHFLQFDRFESFARVEEPVYRWNRTNAEQITHTAQFCGGNSITLEAYAMQNILVRQNMKDRWVSDILRNLANMYDIRNDIKHPNVRHAWECRFLGQYKNMMTGHFIH